MALQYFDKRVFGAYVVDAWQQYFDTEMDPAAGQRFTNGPNKNGGLYGKRTDILATELIFDTSNQVFTPHQIAAATGIVDNRNGLTPKQTVTLTYSYADATSSTHSTTRGLKIGIGVDIKAKAEFLGTGTEVTTKISTEYTFSWTDVTTITQTETKTFQQAIPVRNVPAGKVYQVLLLCNKEDLRIPYHANVYLTGTSSASFASPVNGQNTWTIDAGTLCDWINRFGSADGESHKFARDPKNPKQGYVSLQGNLTATQTANFTARTMDITDSFTGGSDPVALNRSATQGSVLMPRARTVAEIPLSH